MHLPLNTSTAFGLASSSQPLLEYETVFAPTGPPTINKQINIKLQAENYTTHAYKHDVNMMCYAHHKHHKTYFLFKCPDITGSLHCRQSYLVVF